MFPQHGWFSNAISAISNVDRERGSPVRQRHGAVGAVLVILLMVAGTGPAAVAQLSTETPPTPLCPPIQPGGPQLPPVLRVAGGNNDGPGGIVFTNDYSGQPCVTNISPPCPGIGVILGPLSGSPVVKTNLGGVVIGPLLGGLIGPQSGIDGDWQEYCGIEFAVKPNAVVDCVGVVEPDALMYNNLVVGLDWDGDGGINVNGVPAEPMVADIQNGAVKHTARIVNTAAFDTRVIAYLVDVFPINAPLGHVKVGCESSICPPGQLPPCRV